MLAAASDYTYMPPSTSDAASEKTAEAVGTGSVGTVVLVLFPKRALRFVFLGQGGFGWPGACNLSLKPTQGVLVNSYLVLPRLCLGCFATAPARLSLAVTRRLTGRELSRKPSLLCRFDSATLVQRPSV